MYYTIKYLHKKIFFMFFLQLLWSNFIFTIFIFKKEHQQFFLLDSDRLYHLTKVLLLCLNNMFQNIIGILTVLNDCNVTLSILNLRLGSHIKITFKKLNLSISEIKNW